MQKLFAAIDLGASSGRLIAGLIGVDSIELTEIHRFANVPLERGNSIFWDFDAIKAEISKGLFKLGEHADSLNLKVASIGVDTWAVDYGLIDDEGLILDGVRHYRDERNPLGVALVEQAISPEDLYAINGLQYLPFNTLYQLGVAQIQDSEMLARASKLLLVPDLINHWLSGSAKTEITNASTTGLLSLETKEWNWGLISLLGFNRNLFGELAVSGEVLGQLLPQFRTHSAFSETVVTITPSHDTAAAVAGTPLADSTSAYLSSGTWSLLGVELETPNNSNAARIENFTNELGADNKIRFLKNLSGLWLLQQSMLDFKRANPSIEVPQLLSEAAEVSSNSRINVNDHEFSSPGDMLAKIQMACSRAGLEVPQTPAEITRCILDSLADAYAQAIRAVERLTGIEVSALQIVGGGSQNDLLSQLTADRTQKTVFAGPIEATALGNLLAQASAHGVIEASLSAQRALIRNSYAPKVFEPSLATIKGM